jgi:DNA-binding NarL/FixJ family response regulator
MSSHLRPIVLLDDDPDDLYLLDSIITMAGAANPRRLLNAADSAVSYLSNLVGASGAIGVMPLVCFVDVNMREFDGLEFVEWVRLHDAFAAMPLVIVSGSDDMRHLIAAVQHRAQCYVGKYPSVDAMREILCEAEKFSPEGGGVFRVRSNLFFGRTSLPQF